MIEYEEVSQNLKNKKRSKMDVGWGDVSATNVMEGVDHRMSWLVSMFAVVAHFLPIFCISRFL